MLSTHGSPPECSEDSVKPAARPAAHSTQVPGPDRTISRLGPEWVRAARATTQPVAKTTRLRRSDLASRLDRLDSFELAVILALRVVEVPPLLQVQPESSRVTEELTQSQGRVRRHAASPVHQLIDPLIRHANTQRQLSLRQTIGSRNSLRNVSPGCVGSRCLGIRTIVLSSLLNPSANPRFRRCLAPRRSTLPKPSPRDSRPGRQGVEPRFSAAQVPGPLGYAGPAPNCEGCGR